MSMGTPDGAGPDGYIGTISFISYASGDAESISNSFSEEMSVIEMINGYKRWVWKFRGRRHHIPLAREPSATQQSITIDDSGEDSPKRLAFCPDCDRVVYAWAGWGTHEEAWGWEYCDSCGTGPL